MLKSMDPMLLSHGLQLPRKQLPAAITAVAIALFVRLFHSLHFVKRFFPSAVYHSWRLFWRFNVLLPFSPQKATPCRNRKAWHFSIHQQRRRRIRNRRWDSVTLQGFLDLRLNQRFDDEEEKSSLSFIIGHVFQKWNSFPTLQGHCSSNDCGHPSYFNRILLSSLQFAQFIFTIQLHEEEAIDGLPYETVLERMLDSNNTGGRKWTGRNWFETRESKTAKRNNLDPSKRMIESWMKSVNITIRPKSEFLNHSPILTCFSFDIELKFRSLTISLEWQRVVYLTILIPSVWSTLLLILVLYLMKKR